MFTGTPMLWKKPDNYQLKAEQTASNIEAYEAHESYLIECGSNLHDYVWKYICLVFCNISRNQLSFVRPAK